MNHRRKLFIVLAAGALVNPLAARAQQPPAKPRRIGFLSLANADANAPYLAAFRTGMAALKWADGRDYVIETHYAEGTTGAAAGLAAQLVASRPDLLLATSDGILRLLISQTKTIPIVVAFAQDPVGNGLVASLRRPGGNATGLSSLASSLAAKRLQLLKEAFPHLAHVAVLFDQENSGAASQSKDIVDAGKQLGLRVTPIAANTPADIEPAFKRGVGLGVHAWIVTQGGPQHARAKTIAERAIALKLPVMSSNFEATEAGGLMSYGPSIPDNFRRAAGYVDKIFKGANPGELPIQQPVTFEMVVNLKTAKAIGLTVPPIVMLQADRVIE